MNSAWLTKLTPPVNNLVRRSGLGSDPAVPRMGFPPETSALSASVLPPATTQSGFGRVWQALTQRVQQLLPHSAAKTAQPLAARQPFLMPVISEQKYWQEQIEAYAESPFEKALFELNKKSAPYAISKAWADGLISENTHTKEAALNLLRGFLNYSGLNDLTELSAHTQMKFMIFGSHLTEPPHGRAILYEALLQQPPDVIVQLSDALKKDFQTMSPMAQMLILKQMYSAWKKANELKGTEEEADTASDLKKLMKSLVVLYYTDKNDDKIGEQHEKIRLGFLKLQPVEVAYRKELEEIERKYRAKLRQLKKQRSQKAAESEEDKLRRIELIYDAVETDLVSGLNELNLNMDEVLAV